MKLGFLLWFFLAIALALVGCQPARAEVGSRQPAALTLVPTAEAQSTSPEPTVEAESSKTSPAPRLQLGRLAFVRDGDIWVKELPDGEERRLTQDGHNSEPRWSPLGEWLAFRKDSQVWVMGADGSEARVLANGRRFGPFAWSPNEDRIAYTLSGGLHVERADGSERKEVVSGPQAAQYPLLEAGVTAIAWSPDGQWLAFEKLEYTELQSPRSQGLWRAKADGSEIKEVYLNPIPIWLKAI